MNNSKIQEEIVDQENQKDLLQESRIFKYQQFQIDYLNTLQTHESGLEFTPDVKVNNYLCYQQGNLLTKVTQISYEDKVIKIQDKFEILSRKADMGDIQRENISKKLIKTHDKIRIFNKDSTRRMDDNEKEEKRDKKNIVKNVIKMFCAWIQKMKNEKNSEECITGEQVLRKLMNKQNFNNRLIKNVVSEKAVNRLFLQFLEYDAEYQIKESRIKDKESHCQAIQLYIQLLKKEMNISVKEENKMEDKNH